MWKAFFILSVLLSALCALYWGLPRSWRSWCQRKAHFEQHTHQHYESMYVFLDPNAFRQRSNWIVVLVFLMVWWLLGSFWLALISPLLVLMLWAVWVRRQQRQRLRKLQQQLPDFVHAMASTVGAGVGVALAFQQLSKQMAQPLRNELELCLAQQRLGLSFEDALQSFGQRLPFEGPSLLTAAIQLSHQSGGRLSEVLIQLADSLRTQWNLEQKVRALTSQAVLQAWVMAAMPFLLLLVLTFIQPTLMHPIWHTTTGWLVLGAMILLEYCGLRMLLDIAAVKV